MSVHCTKRKELHICIRYWIYENSVRIGLNKVHVLADFLKFLFHTYTRDSASFIGQNMKCAVTSCWTKQIIIDKSKTSERFLWSYLMHFPCWSVCVSVLDTFWNVLTLLHAWSCWHIYMDYLPLAGSHSFDTEMDSTHKCCKTGIILVLQNWENHKKHTYYITM